MQSFGYVERLRKGLTHDGIKRLAAAFLAICLGGCVVVTNRGSGQPVKSAAVGVGAGESGLVGTWRVDLRPTPSAPAYFQSLEIERIEAGRIVGRFYGAPISEARLNLDWGAPRLAFVTGDASTAYYHSAVLREGRLEGLTHAPGRGMLAVWTAEREVR